MGSAKKQQTKTFRTRATRSTGKANLLTSDPSQNTELLNSQLRSLGLYAAPTLGDGNCLFRALSDQFYGSPSKHHQVRRDVCDFIEANPERYEGFVDVDEFGDAGARKGKGGGLKAYVAGMRENAVYGGHMELSAFAQMTRRNIKVIQPGLVYVIQYDPPQPSTSNTTTTTPKKKKTAVEAPVKPSSTSSATSADDSPSRHTRSSTKSEAALNDRERRHRRRELQRKMEEEEEAKRKQNEVEANSDDTKEETEDVSQLAVDEPHTSGPTIYVAYHDWEHFSSIRSLRGPHTGIPNVEESPAPTSYSSSSSHTSNSPFSQTGSQTSHTSLTDEAELSPAKARKKEREKKEREKREQKIAKAKGKASAQSKATMDRFLKDGDDGHNKLKSKSKSKQAVVVKPEPVDDVLPTADAAPAPAKTGFKLRIPPRKSLVSASPSKASSEVINVDTYPTPSPLTSETESDEEGADVAVDIDEDVKMESPTKFTSPPIAKGSVPPSSVATSPPASHSPSPAPAAVAASSVSPSVPPKPSVNTNPYLNPNMALSHPNLPHPSLSMSNSNISLPNLSTAPHHQAQAQAQAYMAAMYNYAAAAAAAGYPSYAQMYGYPTSPTASTSSTAANGTSSTGSQVPPHLAHQFPYGYPTGYGYPYGFYPSTSTTPPTATTTTTSTTHAQSSSTSSTTPNATSPVTPNPSSSLSHLNPHQNPYIHMQGSYPFPYMHQYAPGQPQPHSQQLVPQPPTKTSPKSQGCPSQTEGLLQSAPPLSHLTHLCAGRTQRSPKRSFEESLSDASDAEKCEERAHSRSLSKDSLSPDSTRSSPGSGNESDFKRSRLDRAGKSIARRSVSKDSGDRENPRVVDISASATVRDLAASDITIKPMSPSAGWPDPDGADLDADADGDPDPDYTGADSEDDEEREVEMKLSLTSVSTPSPEGDDEDDDNYEDEDDTLQPNLNHLKPTLTSSKPKTKARGGDPDGLTRRQRKKLGLPKTFGGGGVGKTTVPYVKTGPSDEWLSNGTGRVDVRGFRELKI